MNRRGQPRATRYAVVFRDGRGNPTAGALIVDRDRLRLEGRSADGRVELSVPYAELTEIRIGRSPEERLNGHPTLLVGREHAPPLQIEPLGAGLLHEIADLLTTLATQHGDSGKHPATARRTQCRRPLRRPPRGARRARAKHVLEQLDQTGECSTFWMVESLEG